MVEVQTLRRAKKIQPGTRVLVRVDFNVPIQKGKILDDSRLRASLATIQFLVMKGARVVLLTHVGRPDGKVVSDLSVAPIAKAFGKLLGARVPVVGHTSDLKKVHRRIQKMGHGEVVMLENVRFFPGEKKNTPSLGKALAALGDVFVLDGFGVAHRPAASVVGIAAHIPAYAGLLLEQELEALNRVAKMPKKPAVLVMGGIKMETKIPVIEHLLPRMSQVLIGGGIANTYFKALGYGIADTVCDNGALRTMRQLSREKKLIVPVDVIVGSVDGKRHRQVDIKKTPHHICEKGESILDVGPQTIMLFSTYIKKAQTIVWNGAMGYFEQKPYDVGTRSVARLVASRSKGPAYGVIGGGETVQSMHDTGMSAYVDHISSGGGAMLAYLSGETLPGIKILKKNK